MGHSGKRDLINDNRFGKPSGVYWTCCGASALDSPGCGATPHEDVVSEIDSVTL